MRVKRIICPSCESEGRIVSGENDLSNYSEEIVSEVCGEEKCKKWYNSPTQRLLRALFGEKE